VLTVFRQLLGSVLALLAMMLIARTLGSEGQGQYTMTIILPVMLFTMLNGGAPTSTVYYVAQKRYSLQVIYSTNFYSALLLSLVAAAIGAMVVLFYQERFFEGVPQSLLLVVLLALPLIFVQRNLQTIFQGEEDFEKFNSIVILNQLGLLLFAALFVWFWDMGLRGAVISFVSTQLLIFLVTVRLVNKTYDLGFPSSFSSAYLKDCFSYGIKGHMSNVLTYFNYRIDLFVIAHLLDNAAVGIYSIAVALVEKVWIVSQSVSAVLFARVATLTTSEERNRFTMLMARNTLLITAIGSLFLMLGVKILLVPIFGEEYALSEQPFLWMIPGVVIFSLGRVLSNDFSGRGKPEWNTYVAFVVAVSNIALNFFLIPIFGLLGAALATTISYLLDVLIKSAVFVKVNQQSVFDLVVVKKSDFELYRKQWDKLKNRLKR
jgi:O-antigen/teichoic acid export membrane protein